MRQYADLSDPQAKASFFGWLHMIYHLQRPWLYAPSVIRRPQYHGCRFCLELSGSMERSDVASANGLKPEPHLITKPRLGRAEQRVYELICEGLSGPEIAERVGRSLSTIKNQTIRIFRVYEVTSREELRVVDHVRKNGPAKPNAGKAKQQRRGPGLEDAAAGRFGSLEARVSALEEAMGLAGDARRCCVVCGGTSQLIRVMKRDAVARGRFVIVCKDFASCRTRVGVVAAR